MVPYKSVEEELTKIPIKEVMLKQSGIDNVYTKYLMPKDGLSANLEKSGALTINVAKFAKEFIVDSMKTHANARPFNDDSW